MTINIIIKALGVLLILLGIVFMIKPQAVKWLMEFINKGKRIYGASVLRFVCGVIFLLGAGQSRHKWIIAVLGILFLLGGLLICMLGPAKIGRMFSWFRDKPPLLYRFFSVILFILGGLIIYAA